MILLVYLFFSLSGYLVIRVTSPQSGDAPLIKQMKWFESHSQHILDMTLDPLGEWLACACLDGALYLLPILNITKKVPQPHSKTLGYDALNQCIAIQET